MLRFSQLFILNSGVGYVGVKLTKIPLLQVEVKVQGKDIIKVQV